MPEIDVGAHTYKYLEKSYGTNRGIQIAQVGQRGLKNYQLRPNPHKDGAYNKKNQPEFYRDLATGIGQHWEAHGTPPADGTGFAVFNVTYAVEER